MLFVVRLDLHIFLLSSAFLLNIFLLFLLLKTNTKETRSFSFSVASLLSWIICVFLFSRTTSKSLATIGFRTAFASASLLGSSLLHFSYTFSGKKIDRLYRYIFFLAIPILVSWWIIFSGGVVDSAIVEKTNNAAEYGKYYLVFAVIFFSYLILTFYNLFHFFYKSKGVKKTQTKFILLGTLISVIVGVYTNMVLPFTLRVRGSSKYGPLSGLSFVILTTYAIVKHRLMDIRFLAVRLASYTLLVLSLGLSYTFLIQILSKLLFPNIFSENYLLFSSVTAAFIAFSFQPLKNLFEKVTDKILYKNRYETETLLKTLSQAITSTIDLRLVSQKLVDILCQEMRVVKGSLISFGENNSYTVQAFYGKNGLILKERDVKKLKKRKNVLITSDPGERKSIKKKLNDQRISVAMPLRTEKRLVGFLFLGEKASGDVYFTRDIEALEILAPQAAIAIENAHSYEKIQQFSNTLRKRINRATHKLRKTNIRLKELSSLKDEFVSIASHQLRTPMTAIKSYLWLALEKNKKSLGSKTKRNLERAYLSTERTITLVKDMLTVSRIEGRRLDLDMTKFDLYQLAVKIYQELEIKAKEKKIEFVLEKPKQKVMVKGDQDKIREVLQNLTDNAIKFTPEKGSVKIFFTRKPEYVETNISDTGLGISKENMPRLFQKFSRLEHSFSKMAETPGTGLGLYIAKQIVGLHQGKIWVKSKTGQGAVFTFSLPKG